MSYFINTLTLILITLKLLGKVKFGWAVVFEPVIIWVAVLLALAIYQAWYLTTPEGKLEQAARSRGKGGKYR